MNVRHGMWNAGFSILHKNQLFGLIKRDAIELCQKDAVFGK